MRPGKTFLWHPKRNSHRHIQNNMALHHTHIPSIPEPTLRSPLLKHSASLKKMKQNRMRLSVTMINWHFY